MSGYTKGPWPIEESDYGDEIWFGGYGKGMISVGDWVAGGVMGMPSQWLKLQAEARLISCAPEIFELLQEARRTLEMWKDVAPAVSLCTDIDTLIARAKGEQA